MSYHAPIHSDEPASLGRWLLAQRGRTDAIGVLADAARRDPRFPADGDYQAISKRLNEVGAEGDMHQALEDAELDWNCY
jgi:hypothetical protein